MGFISDIGDALSSGWDSITDAASSAWGSIKEETMEFTGSDSWSDALLSIGSAGAWPILREGMEFLGGDMSGPFEGVLGPLMGQQQAPPWATGQMTGPLMGNAPANLTMGTGGQPAPQIVRPSPQDLAGLFGETGYQYGPSQTSTALLQANPEAYQYQPLMSGVV